MEPTAEPTAAPTANRVLSLRLSPLPRTLRASPSAHLLSNKDDMPTLSQECEPRLLPRHLQEQKGSLPKCLSKGYEWFDERAHRQPG